MAKDDDKTTFVFDLDNKKFVKKAGKSQDAVTKIGDKKNFEGLFSSLQTAAVLVGSLGAAFLSLKALMAVVFRADDIRALNEQFEKLTENAGISGRALKKGMEDASDGLIDTNTLLQESNQFLINFGKSAERLPELMEIARKAAVLFGGDTLEQFRKLSLSVTTGSTDTLKQMGLIVDMNKAQREFAKSLGVTVDVLDEAGKRQAVLNAVLAQGKIKFKDIDENIKDNQDSWARLKVEVKGFVDDFSLWFEDFIGPALKKFQGQLTSIIKTMREDWARTFDKGLAGSQKRLGKLWQASQKLRIEIALIKDGLAESLGETGDAAKILSLQIELEKNEKARIILRDKILEQTKEELKLYDGFVGPIKPPEPAGPEGIDLEKLAAKNRRFERDMIRMRQDSTAKRIALSTDEDTVILLHAEQRAQINEAHAARLAELDAQRQAGLMTRDQVEATAVELDAQRKLELIEHERQLEAVRRQANENWLNDSENAAEGVQRAFIVASKNAAAEQRNFAKLGRVAVQSYEKHATSAFLAVGEGSKNLGEAMKGFILGALADIAESQGRLYLLQGFTNPALFGAGAALIALAGFLRSQAGGAGGELAGGSGGGGGGAAFSDAKPDAEEQQQKAVTINFQGDYFETDETKQRLVEMIRETQDATEYNINRIGG